LAKLDRLTAKEAEKLLVASGFNLLRQKGSHRIYMKNQRRVVLPFHSKKILHPKIVKQVYAAIEKMSKIS
jgi:predicted RNA binding protein YcfA (HicA-like mRNA interferase family)